MQLTSFSLGQLTSRPLTVDDAAAITEILDENEAAEPAELNFDLTEIDELLTGPTVDLPRGSIALSDAGRMVAFGVLELSPPSAEWKALAFGGVRTAYCRRGVGTRVLGVLNGSAAALRDLENRDQPGELRMWLPSDRLASARLAARAGFEPRRYYFDMRCDLGLGLPAPAESSDDLSVLPWSLELDESLWLASNESFADHWGSTPTSYDRWRHMTSESASFRPELCRLAVEGGRVIGFVLVTEFVADTRTRGYRTGYISRVGTRREARGRGIASALMTTTMRALDAEGYRAAELGVDTASPTGANRLYERLGFTELRRNVLAGRTF